jgi:hypothetical protein
LLEEIVEGVFDLKWNCPVMKFCIKGHPPFLKDTGLAIWRWQVIKDDPLSFASMSKLPGHAKKITKISIHPSGKVATALG